MAKKRRSDDGEPDMSGPGMEGYKRGGMVKVMGAGMHKGEKGAGAMHGHADMNGDALGHKPMAVGAKLGHKAMN